MTDLKKAWNKMRVKMAASAVFGHPHRKVVDKLENEGWKFETKTIAMSSMVAPVMPPVYVEVSTPEGQKVIVSDPDLQARYKQARIKAAEEIFNPKP